MIKGVWEWSIVDETQKTHIIKLDNTEGKRIIYLDEHQIDSGDRGRFYVSFSA